MFYVPAVPRPALVPVFRGLDSVMIEVQITGFTSHPIFFFFFYYVKAADISNDKSSFLQFSKEEA